MIEGYMVLHKNKKIEYFPKTRMESHVGDKIEILHIWPYDRTDRGAAWQFLIEAGAAGAKTNYVRALAREWGCTNEDGDTYCRRMGINTVKHVDGQSIDPAPPVYQAFIKENRGFGLSLLEALIDLCKNLGFIPGRHMIHFHELVRSVQ